MNPYTIPKDRSSSLSSITLTLHATGFRAPPQSEVTDSPSSTQSTPPVLSSSLPNPSPISREFLRKLRAGSVEHLAGSSSLKRKELERRKLPVSQVIHHGKVNATSGVQSMAFRTVTVIPREDNDKLSRTRHRVVRAVSPLIDLANYVGRTTLVVGADVLPYVPVPGLAGIAKLLLNIWDALLLVSANKQAFLRLTDRCATILSAIHDEVRRVGSEITDDLQVPLQRLECVFTDIHQFLQRQIDQPFLKQYLKRDDINAEIINCNTDLQDCLDHFGRSINLRVLAYVKPTVTSKLPGHETSQDILDPINLPLVNFRLEHSNASDDEVREEIMKIQTEENMRDISHDRVELEETLRQALEAKSDAETVKVLQLSKVDMLEAIKMLLRALEQTHRATALPDAPSKLSPLQKRSSTWPLDHTETKEIELLHQAFLERSVAALKREWAPNGQLPHLPSWTITKYEVDLGALIGRGYFSNVYKGTWHRRTVAVKVLESCAPDDLLNEVNIWKPLRHRNILQLYGASSSESPLPWFIISPFIQNGSLSDYLKRHDWETRKGMSTNIYPADIGEPNFLQLTYDVANGMQYLHQIGILHCDLKAANVLVDNDIRCLIADFGQSKFTSNVTHETIAPDHALRWQAPEIMHNRSGPTRKADVYSFAMCCVEILTMGSIPWPGESDAIVRKAVLEFNKRPPYPTDLSRRIGLEDIIHSSWDSAFEDRPSFANIKRSIEHIMNPYNPMNASTNSPNTTSGTRSSSGIHIVTEEPDMDTYFDLRPVTHGQYEESSITTVPYPASSEALTVKRNSPSSAMLPLSRTIAEIPKISNISGSPSTIGSSIISFTDIDSELEANGVSATPPTIPLSHDPSEFEYELTYRQCLSHEFPRPLNVPLWTPSRVTVGDVGYLEKPSGRFIRLFSAFDPATSSQGQLDIPGLSSLAEVSIINQKDRRKGIMRRGMKVFFGVMAFKPTNSPKRSIERTIKFAMPSGKSAYLHAEKTSYQYLEGSPIYKEWFKSYWQAVLSVFGNEHNLQKEDLMLVIECFDAKNFAMLVNHGYSNQEAQFDIFSPPEKGEDWGAFTSPTQAEEGGSYRTKVSEIGKGPMTLLVSRLRFQPDVEEPTLLP